MSENRSFIAIFSLKEYKNVIRRNRRSEMYKMPISSKERVNVFTKPELRAGSRINRQIVTILEMTKNRTENGRSHKKWKHQRIRGTILQDRHGFLCLCLQEKVAVDDDGTPAYKKLKHLILQRVISIVNT